MIEAAQPRTRRERKAAKEAQKQAKTSLNLRSINPHKGNQIAAFESFWSGKNLMLHGCAGVGKSFIALYLGLQGVIEDREWEKVVVCRSVVPTRDMGFLPGSQTEKMKVYETPYQAICTELFNRSDAYGVLKQKGMIEFMSTSFIRGTTLQNCVLIVDEIQNLNSHEANSIITRVGKNCRVIFSGDIRQSDLSKGREKSGLYDFMKIVRRMKSFDLIEFGTEDICRSSLVREYILTRNALEDSGDIESLG